MARNAKLVGAKLARMETDYKKAYDYVSSTGQGLMEEGKDITEYVKKLCPFYYVLDPVMASRASTKPLAMLILQKVMKMRVKPQMRMVIQLSLMIMIQIMTCSKMEIWVI